VKYGCLKITRFSGDRIKDNSKLKYMDRLSFEGNNENGIRPKLNQVTFL
jgi:hypothetical protein